MQAWVMHKETPRHRVTTMEDRPMKSSLYVGMDVHTTNYTLCCYSVSDDRTFAIAQVEPDYHEILKYLNRVEKQREERRNCFDKGKITSIYRH